MTFPRASRLSLTTVAPLLSVTVGANATPAKEPVAAQNAGDPIATAIDEASRRFGIPEAWIRAVMRVERDRKSVVSGKSVSVRVDLGGRVVIKKKKYIITVRARFNNITHKHNI